MQDIQEYNLRGGYVRIPNYGNWCGPGYGGGTPIDQVDSFVELMIIAMDQVIA